MTEQQTDRERRAMWRQIATDAGDDPYVNTLHPDEVLTLLDQLDQLDQAEARIRHLEATAQVLVKEALDAENARDENRRGKAEAEARIKAVQHLIDQADEMGEWAITCTRLQWAVDGSAPQPGA